MKAAALALAAAAALAPAAAQAPRASVYDVAQAYYRLGYLRGLQDALDGATVTGQADRWRLPPAPASLPAQLRAARADAVRTLGADAQAAQCH
ncbi:MAG: hypothetical protein JSR68_08280 [Proteobacteria bacterium]|nr:hypothetical protein [Pseudomonadota bacterium]